MFYRQARASGAQFDCETIGAMLQILVTHRSQFSGCDFYSTRLDAVTP